MHAHVCLPGCELISLLHFRLQVCMRTIDIRHWGVACFGPKQRAKLLLLYMHRDI